MVLKMVLKMMLNSCVVKMIMLNHALPRWWLAAREGVIQLEFADNSTRRRSQHRQEYKQR